MEKVTIVPNMFAQFDKLGALVHFADLTPEIQEKECSCAGPELEKLYKLYARMISVSRYNECTERVTDLQNLKKLISEIESFLTLSLFAIQTKKTKQPLPAAIANSTRLWEIAFLALKFPEPYLRTKT